MVFAPNLTLQATLADNLFRPISSNFSELKFYETEQATQLSDKTIVRHGAGEFPFTYAEKLKPEILEDVLVNFESGNFDAFAGDSFYVSQDLASHYLEKMREWREANPFGAQYLGQKKVIMCDTASDEFYSVPLMEILMREKEPITLSELEKIIAEESLPFKIESARIKFTGKSDLEDSVLDLYERIAERGLADRLPENFFEAKVDGYANFSQQKSADEQNLMNYFIGVGWVTRDGKQLTLEGVKRIWGDKGFKYHAKRLGVRDPRRIIPICALVGLSFGLAYASLTFSGFPQSSIENAPQTLGGEQIHPGGEVQSEPAIWGEHVAWFDMSSAYDRELSDIVIKNLTSGEIKRIHTNGNARSDLMMRGDYIIWQETDWSKSTYDARHSINYHNLASKKTGKLNVPDNTSDASVFGEKLFYTNGTENFSEIFAINMTNSKITQITFDGLTKTQPIAFGDFIAWRQARILDNGSGINELVAHNIKTNLSKTIQLSVESNIGAYFDINGKYLIWTQNGKPAETVTLLGHSEYTSTVDVFALDLKTSAQFRIFSYGLESLSDKEIKISDTMAVWNAGHPRPFKLTDGRSNHRSGLFAYNLSTGQKGAISDYHNLDFNIYENSIVWREDDKVYVRQLGDKEWSQINKNFENDNRDLFNFSALPTNSTSAMQKTIEALVLPPSTGFYLGLAAGYVYYELNVFRPRTQDTKLNELRRRLAAFRHRD